MQLRAPQRLHCNSRSQWSARTVKPARAAPIRATRVAEVPTQAEEEEFSPDVQPSDVAALLTTLTTETQIAQLQLKMGSFQLHVRRAVTDGSAAAPVAAAAAPAAALALPSSVLVAPEPHMSPALALAPLPYISVDDMGVLESVDEALMPVTASKVGILRRGKYAGGKKIGKGNVANVGDQVKKGQVLAYIEQLGTFVEIKAPAGGEVASFQADEGDPVEYQQTVALISPFFGVEETGVTQHRL